MKKILFIILTFITLSSNCQKIEEIKNENKKEVLKLEKRVLILETQISTLELTNTKILSTVYWTLGGLMSVFLAIIGLNFFQNFNLNKKKVDSIKVELNNELIKGINLLSENSINNLKELRKDMKELRNDLKKDIDSDIKSSFNSYRSELKNLKSDYQEIYRSELKRNALEFKKEGKMGYVINLVELLEMDIEIGYDFRIHESLELLSECLDGNYAKSENYTEINKILKKLPEEYELQKKSIESKMKL
jgi:DNA-binding ferritin-like protein (Dps family)